MQEAYQQTNSTQSYTDQEMEYQEPFKMKDLISETFDFYQRFTKEDLLQSGQQHQRQLQNLTEQDQILLNNRQQSNNSDICQDNLNGSQRQIGLLDQQQNKYDQFIVMQENIEFEAKFAKNLKDVSGGTNQEAIEVPEKNGKLICNSEKQIANDVTLLQHQNTQCQLINEKLHNLNLTSQSESINSQDQISVQNLLLSKKRQSIDEMILWEADRIAILDAHESILQNFLLELDKKIQQSKQNFEIYLNFFRQHLSQEQNKLQQIVIDTKEQLQDNNASKTIYLNCSIILNALSDQKFYQKQRIMDFIQILKSTIIESRMQPIFIKGNQRLMQARQNIIQSKNTLKDSYCVDNTLQQMISCYNSITFPPQDFYMKINAFLRRVQTQESAYKKLAQLLLDYYRIAVQQQVNRTYCINQSLIIFSKALKMTHNIGISSQDEQDLRSNDLQFQKINQFYQINRMLDEPTKNNLRKIAKKTEFENCLYEEFSYEYFELLLTNFRLRQLNENLAIMKSFKVQYTNSLKQKQNCILIITIDAYIHLFANKITIDPEQNCITSFQLWANNVNIINKEDSKIEISKKQDKMNSSIFSYFWNSSKNPVYQLLFITNDEKQQFLLTVKNLQK